MSDEQTQQTQPTKPSVAKRAISPGSAVKIYEYMKGRAAREQQAFDLTLANFEEWMGYGLRSFFGVVIDDSGKPISDSQNPAWFAEWAARYPGDYKPSDEDEGCGHVCNNCVRQQVIGRLLDLVKLASACSDQGWTILEPIDEEDAGTEVDPSVVHLLIGMIEKYLDIGLVDRDDFAEVLQHADSI